MKRKRHSISLSGIGVGTLIACLASTAYADLKINIIAPSTISAEAKQGFIDAASLWEKQFTDNITVNLQVDFAALGSGILGQTNPFGDRNGNDTSVLTSYFSLRNALSGDATSADDALAVSHLQVGNSLKFVTTDMNGNSIQDTDASPNNAFYQLTGANAKALHLLPGNDSQIDAFIEFSSNFSFDFDPTNGIDRDKYDFVGVAAHEIGHALGFVSGVDNVDYYSGPKAPGGKKDLNDIAGVFNPLDLYRFSADRFSIIDGQQVEDLRQGKDINGVAVNPYFSIDGGATSIARFATGQFDGDGRQASHWKDNLGLGIMDPTAAKGENLSANLGINDLRAFDVIGYNLHLAGTAPEPGTFGLLVSGLLVGLLVRRHKNI